MHWYGLAIRNDMDGVPGLRSPPVAAGRGFDFNVVVPDPGTHWFHPDTGLQLDHGLYAPFVVDDPHEPAVTTRSGSWYSTTRPTAPAPAPSSAWPAFDVMAAA